MLIFGTAGQGKTYAIQGMLCEMSKFRQNSLIVDYTDGFKPKQLEPETRHLLSPMQHVVRNEPLPINPFLAIEMDDGGIVTRDNPATIARRIRDIFSKVYQTGEQQASILYDAIMAGISQYGTSMNLDTLMDLLALKTEEKAFRNQAHSLLLKFRPFVDSKPFSFGEDNLDWDSLFSKEDPLCNVFQLTGMSSEDQKMIVEFILWNLYGHLQAKGTKTDPKVLVLDEVQNLDHSDGSPLSKYIREGRKFGVSLIMATQTLSKFNKDERAQLFNASCKLFFKPSPTEINSFATLAAQEDQQGGRSVQDWIRNLSALSKGECFFVGPRLDERTQRLMPQSVVRIRISSLKDRGFHV